MNLCDRILSGYAQRIVTFQQICTNTLFHLILPVLKVIVTKSHFHKVIFNNFQSDVRLIEDILNDTVNDVFNRYGITDLAAT